jgi:hypothetical protein
LTGAPGFAAHQKHSKSSHCCRHHHGCHTVTIAAAATALSTIIAATLNYFCLPLSFLWLSAASPQPQLLPMFHPQSLSLSPPTMPLFPLPLLSLFSLPSTPTFPLPLLSLLPLLLVPASGAATDAAASTAAATTAVSTAVDAAIADYCSLRAVRAISMKKLYKNEKY